MKSYGYIILFLGLCNVAISQKPVRKLSINGDSLSPKMDSLLLKDELNANLSDNIPVISIDENDIGNLGSQNVSSALSSNRDPFIMATSFNFYISRFRVRGYDLSNSSIFMNGAKLENLDNGASNYGAFGGLTGILRRREVTSGIRPNTFGYGGIGVNTEIDTRPSLQRKQTEFGYSFSNGNYTHRWSFTHFTGVNKKGWAFGFSGSRRWSDEGYVPGTYTNSWSYYIGIDKKIGQNRTLSLVIFNSPSENGGQRNSVKEMDSLVGSHYYNSDWGYQNGKKRNASVAKTNQPYIILTDEIKFNNSSNLVNAASLSFGTRGLSGLEYNNAPNPTPDYYRYLPSFFSNDTATANLIARQIKTDVNKRQLNWQKFYDVNRLDTATTYGATVNGVKGQTYSGTKSLYIIGERIRASQRANFSSTYNKRFSNHANLTTGIVLLTQNDHNYKRLNDLLGGQYYVDINQYAQGTFPANPTVIDPNLNKPNNIVKTGDLYGYDYNAHINKEQFWSQGVFKFTRFDLFIAGELSGTQFWRVGNVVTGLYPDNSYGKSKVYTFTNFGLKGGGTYKLDGKNYVYLNAALETKAPDFRNVFLSPDSRDQVQDNIKNEKIASLEAGYLFNGPTIKLHATGYYTKTEDEMHVQGFYNEDYYTFTNYAINSIAKVHYGTELGFEAKIIPQVKVTAAAAIGRYYYSSRQFATTINDNTTGVLSRDTIYSQNYRIANTPQEAYSFGIEYRSRNYWYIGLNGNYFDQIWASFNPVRLTTSAVSNEYYGTPGYYKIITQDRLPGQFILDLNAGCSWKLPRQWLHKSFSLFMLSGRISNLLDNKNLITYGGQQLRFDNTKPDKYPPRYSYANGLTFALNATLRF